MNMPTVSNTALTLTTVNSDTTITVDFDTEFNEVERNLRGLGVTYHPHIDVIGVDGATRNVLIADAFPHTNFGAVTAGVGPQTISRSMSITIPRSSLQEDTGGDEDEISCDIRIHTVGLPATFTADVASPTRVLLG
jgi:hypothetical protein